MPPPLSAFEAVDLLALRIQDDAENYVGPTPQRVWLLANAVREHVQGALADEEFDEWESDPELEDAQEDYDIAIEILTGTIDDDISYYDVDEVRANFPATKARLDALLARDKGERSAWAKRTDSQRTAAWRAMDADVRMLIAGVRAWDAEMTKESGSWRTTWRAIRAGAAAKDEPDLVLRSSRCPSPCGLDFKALSGSTVRCPACGRKLRVA